MCAGADECNYDGLLWGSDMREGLGVWGGQLCNCCSVAVSQGTGVCCGCRACLRLPLQTATTAK